MAYIRQERMMKLQINVNSGTVSDPTYKKRNLGQWVFDPDLTDNKCYTAGSLYADLQTHPLESVIRTDKYYIIQQ